jgi:hypothetical protein
VLLPLPDGALKINNPFFIFSSSFLYLLFDRGAFGTGDGIAWNGDEAFKNAT